MFLNAISCVFICYPVFAIQDSPYSCVKLQNYKSNLMLLQANIDLNIKSSPYDHCTIQDHGFGISWYRISIFIYSNVDQPFSANQDKEVSATCQSFSLQNSECETLFSIQCFKSFGRQPKGGLYYLKFCSRWVTSAI